MVIPNPDASVFVHMATAGNSAGNYTTMDYPLKNNDSNAIVFVTPNWNPDSVGGTYDDHPIGVYYASGKWRVFNQDGAAIPVNAAFNVFVPQSGANVFVQTATVGNTISDSTTINNPLTNGNPNAIILVTPNYNPGGSGGTLNNHPIGDYNGSKWEIFNQDLASITIGAAFNIYVFGNFRIYLPLVIR